MHFFNPAPVMKLVEVIAGLNTPDEVVAKIKAISEEIGKTPVQVEEAAGFVVNRILIPMINEAIGIYADGVASVEGIDAAMKLGANHPMGPRWAIWLDSISCWQLWKYFRRRRAIRSTVHIHCLRRWYEAESLV